jgi:hypothetical protein
MTELNVKDDSRFPRGNYSIIIHYKANKENNKRIKIKHMCIAREPSPDY